MAYYWTAFNWDDYDRKTQHLSLLRHGAYVQLIKHYYRTRGPLEADVKQLLFICRASTPDEIEAVNAVLAEFFVLRDGKYHHNRCDEEIARAYEISEKRAFAGAKGGARKRQAIARQMPTQLQQQLHTQIQEPEPTRIVLRIAQSYPFATYEDELKIPPVVAQAIIQCIESVGDGEKVLEYTKRYAASCNDPNRVMSMEKFFKDPMNYKRPWRAYGEQQRPTSNLEQLRALRAANGPTSRKLAERDEGRGGSDNARTGVPPSV